MLGITSVGISSFLYEENMFREKFLFPAPKLLLTHFRKEIGRCPIFPLRGELLSAFSIL